MQFNKHNHLLAIFLSVALHALVISLASNNQVRLTHKPAMPEAEETIAFLEVLPPSQEKNFSEPVQQTLITKQVFSAAPAIPVPQDGPVAERQPASQAAPPAPTAQEWAFAAKYTLKNSKGYRYIWG